MEQDVPQRGREIRPLSAREPFYRQNTAFLRLTAFVASTLAAAAVIVTATSAAVIGGHQTVVAAATEQDQQDDDPPAAVVTKTVITHISYLRDFVAVFAAHSMVFHSPKNVRL